MSKRTEIHIGDKYGRLSIVKEIEPTCAQYLMDGTMKT